MGREVAQGDPRQMGWRRNAVGDIAKMSGMVKEGREWQEVRAPRVWGGVGSLSISIQIDRMNLKLFGFNIL